MRERNYKTYRRKNLFPRVAIAVIFIALIAIVIVFTNTLRGNSKPASLNDDYASFLASANGVAMQDAQAPTSPSAASTNSGVETPPVSESTGSGDANGSPTPTKGGVAGTAGAENSETNSAAGGADRTQDIRMDLDPDKPMVALTFDDGPAPGTDTVLALLSEYDGRATFFVVGNRVEKFADQAKAVVAQGSQIAGHSWDHENLAVLSKKNVLKELNKTNDVIKSVTGVSPIFYRPPYGEIDKQLRTISKSLGQSMIMWDVDTRDWDSHDPDDIFNKVKKNTDDGSIVLSHDIHKETIQGMKKVIPWLAEQGYQLVTVSELMYYKNIDMQPGESYNNGIQ